MNNKTNTTLLELLAGIILFEIVFQVICLIIAKDYLYNAIGLGCGAVIACFMAIHMKRSIEDALDLGEDAGVKHIQKAYGTRMAVVAIAIIVILITKVGNPITLVIGIIPLKFSAYMQPFTHKVFSWFADHRRKNKI